jgi:hypothetical protein
MPYVRLRRVTDLHRRLGLHLRTELGLCHCLNLPVLSFLSLPEEIP